MDQLIRHNLQKTGIHWQVTQALSFCLILQLVAQTWVQEQHRLNKSMQGPVASVIQTAEVYWLASNAPQLLQICLLSAPCSPNKCWVSNERQHRAEKEHWWKEGKRKNRQRCEQMLMLVLAQSPKNENIAWCATEISLDLCLQSYSVSC